MLLVITALVAATEHGGTPRGPWTRRSLQRYVRARQGMWRGAGRLTNTLTGARLADVAFLERVAAEPNADAFGSERVLVYRAADGSRPCPPLRYAHNVSLQLEDGNLLLRAQQPGVAGSSASVASGWGIGRGPRRLGLRRAYEISVRPVKQDAAAAVPPPAAEAPSGWPRTAARGTLGTTREEYWLCGRSLGYKRTGRCPTWYGGGVCTLEVVARAERPRLPRPWRRLRRRLQKKALDGEADDDWEQRVNHMVEYAK